MANRIFIIHGWDGNPHDSWKPWLKKEPEMKSIFLGDIII